MILGYLILAHLLGDFVFQPGKLVLWKMKSQAGTLVHALTHFALTSILLLPFIINGYPWLLFIAFDISFCHFCIDQLKINYDLKHDKKVIPFLCDQLMHFFILLISWLLISENNFKLPSSTFYKFYNNLSLINFLSMLILLTSGLEIYHFQKRREHDKNATYKINTKKTAMRLIVWTLLYAIFTTLSFYVRG